MKTVTVELFLPELKAHHAYQTVRASGSRLDVAIGRAIAEVLKRDGVKRHKLTKGKITFAIVPEARLNAHSDNDDTADRFSLTTAYQHS